MKKIGVGLYGSNGHQVGELLESCPYGEVVASAVMKTPAGGVPEYGSLQELLQDPRVELVSLCSPRREDQVADAIACLEAGRHVYAEKPAALYENDLDRILAVAKAHGREFHEMADTVFHQPLYAMREIVRSGRLGEVAQIWAQKSYPAALSQRPQDERVDGGLIRQCSIHAVRMVEHLTGLRVTLVEAIETKLGNPETEGGLHMAASIFMRLENGGVGSIVANYLNPKGFGRRGNEQVRVFGTKGIAELVDDLQRSRVVIGDTDEGEIDSSGEVEPYLYSYLKQLLGLGEMPMSLEEELHPLRVVIRAKESALAHAQP